ncbi:MAG TPA: thioredoxin [Stellaceae bacterium]|nr:thioredoxin [Stellaceae bacterium]
MTPTKVTDASFEADVLQAQRPVVVDFWAQWCGPCVRIAPFLESMAAEMADRITIAKLNVDENPEAAMKYGVQSIPTLLLFKNGQVAAMKVGAANKGDLVAWVESNI